MGNTLTVNVTKYRNMLQELAWKIWTLMNCGSCRTVPHVTQQKRLNSRPSIISLPDFTMKPSVSSFYRDVLNRESMQMSRLNSKMKSGSSSLNPTICKNVMKNFVKRTRSCSLTGSYFLRINPAL